MRDKGSSHGRGDCSDAVAVASRVPRGAGCMGCAHALPHPHPAVQRTAAGAELRALALHLSAAASLQCSGLWSPPEQQPEQHVKQSVVHQCEQFLEHVAQRLGVRVRSEKLPFRTLFELRMRARRAGARCSLLRTAMLRKSC